METSLSYGGDAKAFRIHAKQKLPLDSKTHLQFSASLGVGLQYVKREKLHYTVRGKKSLPMTTDGLLSFNVKGRCNLDKEFKERNSTRAAEFSWSVFNFQKDQDVRLKLGYDMLDKIPYMQIRENNWTFNANGNGKWNVRFHL